MVGTQIILETAALAIEDAAVAWAAESDSDWHMADAADLRNIARHIRANRLVDAKCAAWLLDTVVREQIPKVAWPLLGIRPLQQ